MRRAHRFTLATSLAALAALAGSSVDVEAAPSQRRGGRWELLGQREVTDRADRDTVPVTAHKGACRAVVVEVAGQDVQFRSMKIHFANGTVQDVELRNVIPAGRRSRVIDVDGRGERVIRSVDLAYDAQSLGGRRATVKLFGRN